MPVETGGGTGVTDTGRALGIGVTSLYMDSMFRSINIGGQAMFHPRPFRERPGRSAVWMGMVQERNRAMRKTIALMSLMLAGAASPGLAQESCLADVQRFADAHGLSLYQPQARPGDVDEPAERRNGIQPESPITSEDLAESGGVIEPPPIGSGVVIEPPERPGLPTPTAPPIEPSPEAGTGAMDRAAERAQVETLLQGALSAAERGDARQCQELLQQAHDIARNGGEGAPM